MDNGRKMFIRKRNRKTKKRRQMKLAIVRRERERMG